MTTDVIAIAARPRTVNFWGQEEELWEPSVYQGHHKLVMGLVGSERDAMRAAEDFRKRVYELGWEVAADMHRRANAPSYSGGYREAWG